MVEKIAAIDFDGVIHEYAGWNGEVPKGQLIQGTQEALVALKKSGYRVVIHSARNSVTIHAFLIRTGLMQYIDEICKEKPPATVFFDDRAIHVPANQPFGLYNKVTEYLTKEWPIP